MKRIIISLVLVSFALCAYAQESNPSELWIFGNAQKNMLYKSVYILPPGKALGQFGFDYKNSWLELHPYTLIGNADKGRYYEQGIEVDVKHRLNKDLVLKGILWPFFFSCAPSPYKFIVVGGAELASKSLGSSFGALYAYIQPPAGEKPYNGAYIYVSKDAPFLLGTTISGELGYNSKFFIRGEGLAARFGLCKDICFSDSVVLSLSWCHFLGAHAVMDPYDNNADVWSAKLSFKIF
jgi:hypothetical protein